MFRITVEPFVAFSILDHHMRRSESSERVLGLLQGSRKGTEVEIRNYVPAYNTSFADLLRRSCPNDNLVGYYATGLEESDAKVQEEFEKNLSNPIFLKVVMPTEEKPTVDFKAFVSVRLSLRAGSCMYRKECPCVIQPADYGTEVTLHSIAAQRFPETYRATDPRRHVSEATMPQHADGVSAGSNNAATAASAGPSTDGSLDLTHHELRKVQWQLQQLDEYVSNVIAKKEKGDVSVGRALSQALARNRLSDGAEKQLEEKITEALMFQYCATLLQRKVPLVVRGRD